MCPEISGALGHREATAGLSLPFPSRVKRASLSLRVMVTGSAMAMPIRSPHVERKSQASEDTAAPFSMTPALTQVSHLEKRSPLINVHPFPSSFLVSLFSLYIFVFILPHNSFSPLQ